MRDIKIIILAAGKGSRISRYLNNKPKCTLPIQEGRPLIYDTLEKLYNKGIHDVVIVTGYQQKWIRETLKDFNVKYYYNPFYEVTNSLASLWFAKEEFLDNKDIIIMNADVYFEEVILDQLIDSNCSPLFLMDSTRKKEADYKFKCKNGLLIKYGKELELEDTDGEYIGMGKIKYEHIPLFVENIKSMIEEKCLYNCWWEEAIYNLSTQNNIFVEDIQEAFWAEIDYVEDYERILAYIRQAARREKEYGKNASYYSGI